MVTAPASCTHTPAGARRAGDEARWSGILKPLWRTPHNLPKVRLLALTLGAAWWLRLPSPTPHSSSSRTCPHPGPTCAPLEPSSVPLSLLVPHPHISACWPGLSRGAAMSPAPFRVTLFYTDFNQLLSRVPCDAVPALQRVLEEPGLE